MGKEKPDKRGQPCDFQSGCCRVESVVTVDERGQLILPKEIRQKAGILPGEKLLVVALQKNDTPCCLALVKARLLEKEVEELISPLFQGLKLRP